MEEVFFLPRHSVSDRIMEGHQPKTLGTDPRHSLFLNHVWGKGGHWNLFWRYVFRKKKTRNVVFVCSWWKYTLLLIFFHYLTYYHGDFPKFMVSWWTFPCLSLLYGVQLGPWRQFGSLVRSKLIFEYSHNSLYAWSFQFSSFDSRGLGDSSP